MSNPAFRFARVSGQSIDWMLKRNCSVTPSQLGWAYGALCVTSLGIGAWFWAMGARFVLGFAWIELMAVGLAFFAYARLAITWHQPLQRAVHEHRSALGDEAGEQTLRFAERVGEDHARALLLLVGEPPRVDLLHHQGWIVPAIHGERERGFGDEMVAADRLERRAGRIRFDFVVAADDADLAGMFDAHLRRAEDVAGGSGASNGKVACTGAATSVVALASACGSASASSAVSPSKRVAMGLALSPRSTQ